ncbi:MAG: ABC transporter substrate-binding protein [Oscillospiraceae bacterium]|nr:ABC transporter substrate-binding protein [Oscillospiraceae bacterium]
MKKKILSLALCFCLLTSVAALGGCVGSDRVTLNVYNWGEYIDMSVKREFERETGIKVNYTTYDTNEAMYAKISSGAAAYDVIFPSDYMISKMIAEDMLAELDFSNIPNYSMIGGDYKDLEYDPQNKYSVPYTWGTIVIIYNTKMVDPADVEAKSVDLLWNEKYSGQILMFDNPRDAFGLALSKLGYSMNSDNEAEWREAAAELKKQKPLLQAYVMDQIFDKMSYGEAAIAPYYAGDALIMQEDNPDIDFYLPAEGFNLFVDAMCVMKNSKHKKEAEEFINFMCRTDIAVKNAEAIGYATPQMEAKSRLDSELTSNLTVYPTGDILEKAEAFYMLPKEINQLQSDLWTELKKD